MATDALDELLRALANAGIRFVVVGGIAVGVHGFVRATKDVDICPDPAPENLGRLAALLRDIEARHADLGDFDPSEFPYDPTDPAQLAEGGNFRLETRLGSLDVMQWIAGIEDDHAYAALDRDAITMAWRDVTLRICSFEDLLTMKRAAGRPSDLEDIARLQAAHGPG